MAQTQETLENFNENQLWINRITRRETNLQQRAEEGRWRRYLEEYEGNYSEAASMYEMALEINDRSYQTWGNLAAAYNLVSGKQIKAKEKYWRAIGMAEEERKINPRDADVISRLAGYYATIGEREKALENVKESLNLDENNVRVMYRTGTTYELLGEREKALHWIRKTLENGYSRSEIENQPEMKDFVADPRYKKFAEELNTKEN